MNLSPNFTLEEFIFSQAAARLGIDNTPPPEVMFNLRRTAAGCERIRALTQKSILITSGYRCPELNATVGGSKKSQHVKGEAADIICPGYGNPIKLAVLLEANIKSLGIDQLILEYDRWVHVSFAAEPRGQALTIRKENYMRGIVSL